MYSVPAEKLKNLQYPIDYKFQEDYTLYMTMEVVWHGSQQESFDLVNAIARNCTCEFGLMGRRLATCAPHRMLTEDQRALNGLLFARRMAERLRREEHDPSCYQGDESDIDLARIIDTGYLGLIKETLIEKDSEGLR